MSRGVKKTNEYTSAMGWVYTTTPKAVFAAIALSFASWAQGDEAEDMNEAVKRMVAEWDVLHQNGIIPQPAPKI